MRYIGRFYRILQTAKHHGAGAPEARGRMQLHRLHHIKAGPGCSAANTRLHYSAEVRA